MTDAMQSLAILQRIAEFIQRLPETDVADLAEGKAILTIIPAGETEPRRPAAKKAAPKKAAAPFDAAAVVAALESVRSRDEGAAVLKPLSGQQLKDVAAILDTSAAGTKTVLAERIIERTIGFRLNSAAIRQL